jgi:glucosamine-6-phosphate deaminase
MSLTVTAIMNCKAICCSVPDERKSDAVYNTMNAPISTDCPGTILREHPETILYLDAPSAGKL